MKTSLRLETLDMILQDDILPAVRKMVDDAVQEVVAKAQRDLQIALIGIGVDAARNIRLIASKVTDGTGTKIEVVVTLDRPDAA